MRAYLDCYPCFVRQALTAARMAGADESQRWSVLRRTLEMLQSFDLTATPPEIGTVIHRIVREDVGDGDPYVEVKAASTSEALHMYPRLREMASEADDPLDVAIRLSIAGNIIDFGLGDRHDFDLWNTVDRVLAQPFAVDDRPAFFDALEKADEVLYLADNAGETVFDRVLIELLEVPVVYVVKGGPVLNDAVYEDAVAAGLDQVAEIIDNGAATPGTIVQFCSDDFQERFAKAEMIIAKGQGNYETLSEAGPRVFNLLQVKCPVIARDIGKPVGSIVLKQATESIQSR